MHKMLSILALTVALTGCNGAPPISEEVADNGTKIYLIAVVDGCNLWAIDQGGITRTVYMARCPEGAVDVQSSYSVHSGKTITTHDQQTVGAQ